jgi:hypothetical protein
MNTEETDAAHEKEIEQFLQDEAARKRHDENRHCFDYSWLCDE